MLLDDTGADLLIAFQIQFIDRANSTKVSNSAAGNDPFFNSCFRCMHCIFNTCFLFLHFSFSCCAYFNDSYAANKFGQTFLQLFAIII